MAASTGPWSVPFREAKAKIAAGDYGEAYQLCERATSLDGGRNLVVLSAMGNCALQMKWKDKAAQALEAAVRIDGVEIDTQQRLWKTLAELYEETAQWGQRAAALLRLYEIVAKKGNVERATTIAEQLTECYLTAELYEIGALFVLRYLGVGMGSGDGSSSSSSSSSSSEHVLKLVGLAVRLQANYVQFVQKASRLSVGSKPTALHSELETAAFSTGLVRLLPRVVNAGLELRSDVLVALVTNYVLARRSAYLQSRDATQLDAVCQLCVDLRQILVANVQALGSLLVVFVEAWLARSADLCDPDLETLVDLFLANSVGLSTVVPVKIFQLLARGKLAAARPLTSRCLEFCRENASRGTVQVTSTEKAPSSFDSVSQEFFVSPLFTELALNFAALSVSLAFSAFRGVDSQFLLHATEKSKRYFAIFRDSFELANKFCLDLQTKLAYTLAYSVFNQPATAQQLYSELAADLALSASSASDSAAVAVQALSLPACWLLLKTCNRLALFDQLALVHVALTARAGSTCPSWLSFEHAQSCLLRAFSEKASAHRSNACLFESPFSVVQLEESAVVPVIRALQGLLKSRDDLTAEFEAEVHYFIGLAMWLSGGRLRTDKNGCIASLLNAAKLDPAFLDPYTLIGHYYRMLGDLEKASKCYLKVLSGNPLDDEAGVALIRILIESNQADAAIKMLNDFQALTSHAKWTHPLLGQIHFVRRDFESAVSHFQFAIELDAADFNSWVSLGVCYSSMSQFVSAQKAFLRALQLRPADVFVLNSVADIERKLCLLHEALAQFRASLAIQPKDNFLALKGVAEVNLALAYQNFANGWTRGAGRNILDSVAALDEILGEIGTSAALPGWASQLTSLYKLKGDVCLFASNLGPSDLTGQPSPAALAGPDLYRGLLDLLLAAQEAYKKTLLSTASPESAMYFDLGSAFFQYLKMLLLSRGRGALALSVDSLQPYPAYQALLEQARDNFTRGLELNPSDSHCWVGLGLCLPVADKYRRLCFIRATQIDNNASAFANLGLDFMCFSCPSLAKDCFSALQLVESNPIVWVNIGHLFEGELLSGPADATPARLALNSAFDAYHAALEVAKPAEALLGSAVSWLRLHQNLNHYQLSLFALRTAGTTGTTGVTGTAEEGFSSWFDRTELHHEVELKLESFISRKPLDLLAHFVYAWALEVQGKFEASAHALLRAVRVMNALRDALQDPNTLGAQGVVFAQEEEASGFERLLAQALTGIARCRTKLRLLSGAAAADKLASLIAVLVREPDLVRSPTLLAEFEARVKDGDDKEVKGWLASLRALLDPNTEAPLLGTRGKLAAVLCFANDVIRSPAGLSVSADLNDVTALFRSLVVSLVEQLSSETRSWLLNVLVSDAHAANLLVSIAASLGLLSIEARPLLVALQAAHVNSAVLSGQLAKLDGDSAGLSASVALCQAAIRSRRVDSEGGVGINHASTLEKSNDVLGLPLHRILGAAVVSQAAIDHSSSSASSASSASSSPSCLLSRQAILRALHFDPANPELVLALAAHEWHALVHLPTESEAESNSNSEIEIDFEAIRWGLSTTAISTASAFDRCLAQAESHESDRQEPNLATIRQFVLSDPVLAQWRFPLRGL